MIRDEPRRRAILRRILVHSALAGLLIVGDAARADEPMVFPGRDWEEATPASRGVDPGRLAEAIAYLEDHSGPDGVRQLVIVRDGRLIWAGPGADEVHGVWSCTKTFTSTALGLLIGDGKCRLDSLASEFVPALAGSYPEVTLRHFASMTSGYRALGDEPRGGYTHGPSTTPLRPDPRPLFTPPGSRFAYWDSAMNQFALVLTRIAGEPLEDLFRRRVAGPIGMDPSRWSWGDLGAVDGLTVNGGAGNTGAVQVSARALARLGHLFLNRGRWGDRQVLDASWVDAATTVQVPASRPLGHPESGIDGRGVYGLNWWVNGVGPDGTRKWPGAPAGAFAASGYNNNDLFVIPEWRMVVVRLGLDQPQHEITDAEYGTFLRMVGQAIEDDPPGGDAPRPQAYFPPPESEGGWRTLDDPQAIRRLAGMDPARLEGLRDWLRRSDDRDFAAVVITGIRWQIDIGPGRRHEPRIGQHHHGPVDRVGASVSSAAAGADRGGDRFPSAVER